MSPLSITEVLALSPNGIVLLDAAGNVTCVNQAAADIFGLDPQAVAGRPWQPLLETRLVGTPAAAADGEPAALSVRAEDGGAVRWLEEHRRARENGGQIIYYVDVTGHHQTERKHKRERELLQRLFDSLPVMITVYDPAVQQLRGNHAFQELTGWSNKDLATIDIMEAAYPDPEYREEIRRFMESCDGWRDIELTVRDGSILHSRWANIHLSDDRQVGIGLDIQAEKAGEMERARLEAVLAQMPAGVIIAEAPSGRILMANEQVTAILRHRSVTAQDIEGYEAYRGFYRDGRPLQPEEWPLARAIATGEVIRGEEIAFVRGDGTRGTMNISAAPIRDDGGEIVAAVAVFLDVTRQKEMAEALRAREREFTMLANSIPQLAWMGDASGDLIWYNQRWYDFTGTTFEEMKGWGWQKVHHPDHVDRVSTHFKEAIDNVEPWEDTFPLRGKDGEYRWFLSRALPILDDSGQVVRWFGTNTDITESMQLEEALLESQARFRRLLEEAPAGIVMYDQDGVFSQVNGTFTRMTGYRLEDIPTMDAWLERAYRDRAPEMADLVGRLPQHDAPFQQELQIWTAWDELRTFVVSSVSLEQTELGRLRMSTFVDVTGRKEAEAERERLLEALAAEQAQLRRLNETLEERVVERTLELVQARDHFYTLFHASPVPKAITRVDDGLIRNVNTAYEQFFGYEGSELVGRTVTVAGVWPATAGRSLWLARLREQGDLRNVEIQVQHASGERRTVLASATLFEMEGETHAINAFIDITERIKAEQEIRHLAFELTMAEQQERRRIAQFLHDDIQQMLVAHQLSLHMLGLKGTEELRHQLEAAGRAVGDIIEATRSLSGELAPPAVLSGNLRTGLSWLASHMQERHRLQVAVEVAPDCTLPDRKLRELVIQLVRELLFNVVKHADTARARVRAYDAPGWLVVEVADEGQGFDPAAVLDDGSIPAGFGLYSIRERLELFGGDFSVSSAPGEGTRVTISIPREESAAPSSGA